MMPLFRVAAIHATRLLTLMTLYMVLQEPEVWSLAASAHRHLNLNEAGLGQPILRPTVHPLTVRLIDE